MANPSQDQLLSALEKAHLAGDVQGARELATWHNELYPKQPEPEEPGVLDRVADFFTPGQSEPRQPDTFQEDFGDTPLPSKPTQLEQPAPAQNKLAPRMQPRAERTAPTTDDSISGIAPRMRQGSVSQTAPSSGPGPKYDTFSEATGKALRNVPERFQQSAAGLIQMLGEDLSQERDRHIAITSKKLGITPGDYRLLAWAGNEGLIDHKTPIPDALEEIKRNVVGSLDEQQLKQVADMGIINPDEIAGFAKYWREETKKTMEPVNAEPGTPGYYGAAAIGSVAEMGPALLASIITRNPAPAMRIMAGQVSGQSYSEGREEGLSPDMAQFYAVANAAAEAIPEYLPLRVIMKPGQNFFSGLLKGAVAESAQEVFTEAIQLGLDRQMINPEMTWGEARQRLIDAGIVGSIAGPVMSGAYQGAEKIRDIATPKAAKLGQALQDEIEGSDYAVPADQVAAAQLSPDNAQMGVTGDRPTMAELLRERLEARGVDLAAAAQITPEMVTAARADPGQMAPNVDIPFDVPQQAAQEQEVVQAETAQPSQATVKETEAEVNNVTEQASEKAKDRPMPSVDDPLFNEKNLLRQHQNMRDRGIHPQGRPYTEAELAELDSTIESLVKEVTEPVKEITEQPAEQGWQKGEQVEHVTKRGKTLVGRIAPISKAEAQAIDRFAFKKDGGYFIRQDRIDEQEQAESPKIEAEQLEEAKQNEPTELGGKGPEALDGAPAEQVQRAQEGGDSRPGAEEGSGPDLPGVESTGEPGVQSRGSVGERETELPIPAGREPGTAGGVEPGERTVSRGAESEQPDVADGEPVSAGDSQVIKAKEEAAEQAEIPTGTNQESLPATKQPAGMFTITEETGIGEGGAKTKYKNNVEAIRILKTLESEGRKATQDEQSQLALYVGWGGIPQAFYGESGKVSKGWDKEAKQLKEMLTDAEYEAARRSTQDAHYTSYEIVQAMWKALKDMGYKGGKVLEPSVGTGNFIGMMPAGVRSKSQIAAVELDHITGGIAKNLYPGANIQSPLGFQDFIMPDGYFDLVIGNPPFGSQKLYDGKRKHLSKFSIHNYFFAKSVDGLKPGGVLAMVVSSRLMDTHGDAARQYISDRTELMGAVRLPNNAFLKNAGTEVTTDIIFLRKLNDGEKSTGESWMKSETVKDAKGIEIPLNEYFNRHPEMMLGEWGAYGSMYGPNEPALIARDGQDTAALLGQALSTLPKGFINKPGKQVEPEVVELQTSVDNVKVGSMFMDGDKVMERKEDRLGVAQADPVEFASEKARERVVGMIGVRDVFTDLRKAQLSENAKDEALSVLRDKLNKAYDAFVKKHGPINADANKRLFRDDPTWPQIAALEESFDKGITPAVSKRTGEQARKPSAEKAAIFTKRTQSPYRAPTKAGSAKDALATSLSETGSVDIDYMARLYGKKAATVAEELDGLIFEVVPGSWVTRDDFLSGNVKHKLSLAESLAEQMPRFKKNVEALKEVQPEDIEAVDIDVKPGAHWMPREDMKAFVDHILGNDSGAAVYIPMNAKWEVRGNPGELSKSTWATERVSVEDIIGATANQKQIVVRDRFQDGTSVVNESATTAANEKVERMKAEFRRWVWTDDARRSRLVRIYNDTFNTDRLREYDGSHLKFPGKIGDDIITLRPHQANAVWRMVQNGTTLLDHVVGAGKTFTMIAGAMEMRRMGRASKPMFIVPNHLVGQWAEDFTKLYPGANILAATKRDFEKGNRKRLFARIATGDWDAVIVAHSSFGKVEMDPVFQEKFINQQIRDIDEAIATLRQESGGKSRSVKQIEKQKERLQEKLKKLFDADNKDDSLNFGELGIDAVFVDEAHEFKNLGFATSMTRVAGLGDPQGSQKAADLFMKTQYVLEKTGGNNVVFATGTPISNTMAEMYTVQRYLDYSALQTQGLAHFDAWARMYGEVVSEWEQSASNTYKLKSRFSKFVNIPELMQRYLTFGDVINRDDINRQLALQGKRLPVPKIKGGKPENVVVDRSEDQANYIGEPTIVGGAEVYPEGSLVWRTEHIPKKPEKGADNMLKIMSDARKAALDMRMIDPAFYGDNPNSKVNEAAKSIKAIHDQWEAEKGAQLVFIDLSTPKGAKAKEAARIKALMEKAEQGDEAASEALDKMSPDELAAVDGDFSVYDDLRQKLIDLGISENEIAFIHDANTELQKEELFGKVRSGRVRVLFGSTAKMGAGMNVQERLVALHHMDAPWRPSDLEQREGRIIRQGNALYDKDPDGFEIQIRRYATKQTLDSMMWQTIETKARFIEQVRKGNTKTREIEDIGGEAANSAEMKAASSGNPLILEEMDLRRKVRKLEQLQTEHDREQFSTRDRIRSLKREAESIKNMMMPLTKDAAKADKAPSKFKATVGGKVFDKHKEAGQAILVAAAKMADTGKEVEVVGEYAGFELALENVSGSEFVLSVNGAYDYQIDIEDISKADPTGVARRLANTVKGIPATAKQQAARLKQVEKDIPALEGQVKEWPQAKELANAKGRHSLIIDELKPKRSEEQDQDATSAMMNAAGSDTPMPNWRPTYRQSGVPARANGDKFSIGERSVKLKPEDKPTRREGIRFMVTDIIGPRLYQGKVKGKAKLGFYRRNNSEVRVKNYDDVEVMAHEMAHYLDFHYRFSKKFSRSYKDSRFKAEVAGLSYTSQKQLKYKEGFAEFVRLWLTNYSEAKNGAPLYAARFEEVLAEDKQLNKKMRDLQEEMHSWYLQGPRAQLRAKSGKELNQAQQVMEYMQTYPLERYRQEVIDKIHAAKVIERTLHGGLLDAPLSPYKQFQMVNGAESLHESIMKDGTPTIEADGTFSVSGKGLNAVFFPVAKKGWKHFDLLMDYFKARRAQELMRQGRERLFTKQEIEAGLKLGVTNPEFSKVFDEYQEFNTRMLDFYEQMGLLDAKQRVAFAKANQNYVPFHRVIEKLEEGQDGGSSSIGKRLIGGTMNVRDIAENIVESLYANTRAALIARAKQTLFNDIMTSQDGALFAAKLAPDSKLVKVDQEQMAMKVAQAMASLGLTVSKDGMIVAGDPDAEVIDVDEIAEALRGNPELLNFWTYGHKPTTAETYVDSAVIDGKRIWFEVRSPLLVNMLTGMRGFRSGALLNAMFRVKNIQTRTVTSMLQFLGPNAIRDTLSAFVISKNRFIPIYDTLIGMGHTLFQTKLYREFRLHGGGYGTRIEARTEETRSRRQLDLPSRNGWDVAAKMLAGYDRFSSIFEYGSRVGDYRRGRMAGKNQLEAAWEAREVATDFAKMGLNELWAKFLRTVPFMNAGIQGLDKTAREIFEIKGEMTGANLARLSDAKVRFLAAGGVITLMTAILWLINEDDERYKQLTADQKARFWWVWIPGVDKPVKIPRPYDIGHLFATLPEVSLDYIKDRDGREAGRTLAWTLVNTLGIGDYPGIMQPVIEVARNKKFTGSPVVPEHMMSRPAEYQFTDRTPQIYRNLGSALGVSPLVAEHYTKGYLRYVEAYISDGSEALLWNHKEWGERPFVKGGPVDYLTHQFKGQKVPYRTKWTEGYFNLKKRAAGAQSAFNALAAQSIRDGEPLKDFAKDDANRALIGLNATFGQIDRAFKDQDQVLAAIKYNKTMKAEEKEQRIEHWYSQKNKALGQFYNQADKIVRDIEDAMP